MVGAKERRQNNARQQPFASKDVSRLLGARVLHSPSKLACAVEVWILFHLSFNCFHWLSKNFYFTAYHENLVYVAWKHLVSELPVSLQVHVANNYVFPIGALPPGRAEARETLGRSGHNLGFRSGLRKPNFTACWRRDRVPRQYKPRQRVENCLRLNLSRNYGGPQLSRQKH